MRLELSPMELGDCDAYGQVNEAAMAGWALAEAMTKVSEQQGNSRAKSAAEHARASLQDGKRQTEFWFKVTDADTESQAPDKDEEAPTKVQEEREEQMPDIFIELGRLGKEFRDNHVGTQRHLNLSVLATHPKYQGKGAGSMIVKWGCNYADQTGLICGLIASAAGLKLYQSHGFEIIEERDFDLSPYGFDDIERRRFMIRKPQTKTT